MDGDADKTAPVKLFALHPSICCIRKCILVLIINVSYTHMHTFGVLNTTYLRMYEEAEARQTGFNFRVVLHRKYYVGVPHA